MRTVQTRRYPHRPWQPAGIWP